MTEKKESMTKKDAKRVETTIKKRIISVTHARVNEDYSALSTDELSELCKDYSQAKIIDALLQRKCNIYVVVEVIARVHYDNDSVKALARVKRHMKHDKETRIAKRNS